jgi:hypothetical protein
MLSSILFLSFTALTLATPLARPDFEIRQAAPYIPCAGTTGNAQCCATDVLGLADLDCANREYPSCSFPF